MKKKISLIVAAFAVFSVAGNLLIKSRVYSEMTQLTSMSPRSTVRRIMPGVPDPIPLIPKLNAHHESKKVI